MPHLRNENVGDQPPDFARANPCDIECEIGIETLVQINEDENERVERDDGADQSGYGYEAQAPFEFVQ